LLLRLYFDKSHDAVLDKLLEFEHTNVDVLAAQVHGLVVHRQLDAHCIALKNCCRPVLKKSDFLLGHILGAIQISKKIHMLKIMFYLYLHTYNTHTL
jgi:hypothetical protein